DLAALLPTAGSRRGGGRRLPGPPVHRHRWDDPQRGARRRLRRCGGGHRDHHGDGGARHAARVPQARPPVHRGGAGALPRRPPDPVMTTTRLRERVMHEDTEDVTRSVASRRHDRPPAASNAALARAVHGAGDVPPAVATLSVSHPGDLLEREAEALAAAVVRNPGGGPGPDRADRASPAPGTPAGHSAGADGRTPARTADGGPAPGNGRAGVARAADAGPAPDVVAAGGEVPVSEQVTSVLAAPGAGEALPGGVRASVEPHL